MPGRSGARDSSTRHAPGRMFSRIALGALACMAALLALAALSVTLAFTLLTQTRAGRDLVRAEVNGALADNFAGQISLGDFRLSPGLSPRVILEDVRVDGAEGSPIARADRVEIGLWLPALLMARVEVDALKVNGLNGAIVQRGGALNLVEAFLPRAPGTRKPDRRTLLHALLQRGSVALGDGVVQGGSISWTDAERGGRRVQLDDFHLALAGRISKARFEARFALSGDLRAPIARPLALRGIGSGVPFDLIDLQRLEAHLGASSLRARGTWHHADAEIVLDALRLARAELALVVSDPRLTIAEIGAAGAAKLSRGLVTAILDVAIGRGAIALHTQARLQERSMRTTIDFRALDPAAIASGWPSGAIGARLFGTWRAEAGSRLGRGTLSIDAPPSTLGQGKIDAFRADIGVAGDRVELDGLCLAIPGMRLKGSGTLLLDAEGAPAQSAIDSAMELDIGSLSQSAGQISAMLGRPLPAMKGRGHLRAQVQGGGARPHAARIEASLDRFTLGSLRLRNAAITAALPNLKRPLDFEGDLKAERGQLGPLPLGALSLSVRLDGGALNAHAATSRGERLTLDVRGALAADREVLRLDRLDLALPHHVWRLDRPATFSLEGGVVVDRLAISAGRQSLELKGGIARDEIDARIEGKSLAPAAWPVWPMHGFPALGGELDLSAEVKGTLRRPTGLLHLAARDLAIGPIDALALQLHARLADRVRVRASLGQGGQALRLQADLPRLWERDRSRQPLRARLDVEDVEIGRVAAWLSDGQGAPAPLWPEAGKIAGNVDVTGTLAAPEATLTLRAMGVALDHKIPTFDLDLSANLGRTLAARCALALDHGALDLQAQLGVPLQRAIADLKRAQAARLLARPLSLRARFQGIDLERFTSPWLSTLAGGWLSGELTITGTARAPRGTLSLDVRQGAFRDLKNLALSLRLDLRAPSLDLVADMSIANQRLMRLSGSIGCEAASIIAASDLLRHLGNAPLDVAAELGPIDLEQLLGPSDLSMGSIEASAALSGSLDLPRLTLQGVMRDFWLGPKGLGVLRFEGGYVDGRLSIGSKLSRFDKISLDSVAPLVIEEVGRVARDEPAPRTERIQEGAPRSPVLEFSGAVDAPLGLSGRAWDQIDPRALSGDFTFESHGFQLSWISGLLGGGQALAGNVEASISARGRLDDPWARGFLHLEGGSGTLPNVGRLRQIDARVGFEGRTVRIERIGARAGKGEIALQGVAEWPADGLPLALTAELSLSKLPLFVQGQRVGAVTITPGHIAGTLGSEEIALSLNLDELRLDLANPSLGKDLQSLAPHKSIDIRQDRRRRAERPPSPAPAPPVLDLSLRAKSIAVASRDLKLGATADLSLHRREGALTMRGEIRATDGKAELLGRSFELESARLAWDGTPPGEAAIDATVLHENVREGVDVKIIVAGVLPKPRIELTSEPLHGEQELALLIATGRLNQRRGAGGVAAGDGAASIVGAFFADRLRRALSAQLPIDVLQFDLGEEGFTSARIEAGTYLTDDLYLGYRRDFGADPARENVDEVRIEFQLTPTLSIESNYGYGDESRGGIGILYNKDY